MIRYKITVTKIGKCSQSDYYTYEQMTMIVLGWDYCAFAMGEDETKGTIAIERIILPDEEL